MSEMEQVLQRLIKEQNQLCLVVGRTIEVAETINGCIVVTCDTGTSLSSFSHLQFDFNNVTALKTIPDNLFSMIIVDWSTMRYLFLAKTSVAEQISRITTTFLFESSVSSIRVRVGKEEGFEFDNPSHMIISRERFKETLLAPESSAKLKPISRLNGGFASRLVIPAERETSIKSRLIYNGLIREDDLTVEMEQGFKDCLVGNGVFTTMRVCTDRYPIATNGFIRRYLLFS
jgi:hypothetical protein